MAEASKTRKKKADAQLAAENDEFRKKIANTTSKTDDGEDLPGEV